MTETDAPAEYGLRPWFAIAVVYLGIVGGLYGITLLFELGKPDLSAFALTRLVFLGTAIVGHLMLGRRHHGSVFGRLPLRVWFLLGTIAGIIGFGVSYVWVELVTEGHVRIPYVSTSLSLETLLLSPLLVAYTEELLFRGVLQGAVQRATGSPWKAILQTAVFFALIHLVNREPLAICLPHRFAAGVALGWLRWRSNSLWPCVQAHFVWLQVANVG